MRLGINMLNHPPQPFITVCVRVCVFADTRQVGGGQGFRYTYSYTLPEHKSVSAHKHEQIHIWTTRTEGNVTKPVCIEHICAIQRWFLIRVKL